jgi:L-lactate dehydrogenase complex protein LldG
MSRESILNTIKKNKPPLIQLPLFIKEDFMEEKGLKELFVNNVETTGGKVIAVKDKDEVAILIKNLFRDFNNIISFSENINLTTIRHSEIISSKELDELELVILDSQFGVAENGAVWISDTNFSHRLIPFITLHLVLILNEKEIVENMHEAYEKLSSFDEGYGVFISGPSKTADIEQSLVIGAQGPISTTVFLINSQ